MKKLRLMVVTFCVTNGICTRCRANRSKPPFVTCRKCRIGKSSYNRRALIKVGLTVRKKRGRPRKPKTEAQLRDKRREYTKTYKAKKLYKKVRALDIINHAVKRGKSLLTKGE